VVKPPKTEEELKANIFAVYSNYRNEPSSDRRQVCFERFCGYVIQWCTNFKIIPEAREMGLEIYEALMRIVKKEIKDNFFGYLVTTLKNARREYYRKNISSGIKYPRIVKDIEKFISLQESNAERKLTEEEKINFISEWSNKPLKKVREYLEMIDNRKVGSLTENKETELDINPESIFFTKFNSAIIREVVESVLSSKQDRTREFYRALFTAYCINNSIDFDGFASVLNVEILEKYLKKGKKPEQNEVYLMYHPNVKKESAGVRASDMLKTLLNDLKTALEEKL